MGWPRGVRIVVLGWLALAPAAVWAQPPAGSLVLTVEEVVVRALAENPDLRAARTDVDAALGRLQQASLRPNPMLELGGQKALSPDNNLTVGVSLPLDLNGRKEGRVGAAEAGTPTRRPPGTDRVRQVRAVEPLQCPERLSAHPD